MNYRCLTCGYSQDFEPSLEANALHHSRYIFEEIDDCPGCLYNIQIIGGRKNGKISMPLFEEAGKLVLEDKDVKAQFDEIEADFQAMRQEGSETVARKYTSKRAWGFSGDECLELHSKDQE
jgi:hypothetical protein